jgi:hypothetical protein
LTDDEGFDARISRAPWLSDGDIIEEDFELSEEKRHVFPAKNFRHKIPANF